MKRTMSARGSETSCASGRPVLARTPDRVRFATVTPAPSSACRRSDAAASAGFADVRPRYRPRSTTSADSGGDSQDVEAGLPARADPEGVEPRLVGDHRAVDAADAPGRDAPRERGEIVRPESGIAVPAQPEVAVPDVADERAGAHDLGVEPVARPELGECRVGHRQLLVRRRDERERSVAGVDNGARAKIDRERCRARRIDVRHLERTVEAAGKSGVGAARRRDEEEEEDCHGREAWAAEPRR